MIEALLYEKEGSDFLHCYLCAHHCRITDGKFGLCGVRQNVGGLLYTHSYGRLAAVNVDPIEKKPLYHYLPGTKSYSIATIGCNFRCGFCQNWQISQTSFREIEGASRQTSEIVRPEQVVRAAIENKCRSISYTYTEPTIFFEYALECARLSSEKGLRNVFVTNGYMTVDALSLIAPYLGAANVDLKFFNNASYNRICSARLDPVLDSIRLMKEMGVWVEITTLVIPGENDSDGELNAIAGFISSVDKNIPWHVSRFHPDYQYAEYKLTPETSLKKAFEIGSKNGLKYVYAGNVYGWGTDTHCAACGKTLIKRDGFAVSNISIKDNKCVFCDEPVAGIF